MKKKLKRLFALRRNADGGFTLVELIVVIAILAILGGVAVPAYSGYVKKANMQADISLAGEVADALSLYYYSHPNEKASGFVVLQKDGQASGDGEVGDAAMQAVFGEGWKESAKLKYGEWNGAGMLDVLSGYTEADLQNITNSTYLTESSTEGLMDAVNVLTGLASQVIGDSDMTKAAGNLEKVLGKDNAAPIIEKLTNLELMNDSTAISNMLVNSMADSLDDSEALQFIVNNYAAAFAYAESSQDYKALEQMQKNLENVSMAALTDKKEARKMLLNGISGEEYAGFNKYMTDATKDDTLQKDQDALVAMLGAVKEISGNFQDKDSLTNAKLYTTDGVLAQVDDYIHAVQAVAEMTPEQRAKLNNLPAGSVAVFLSADGAVSVCPSEIRGS